MRNAVREAVDEAVAEFFSPEGLASYLEVPVGTVYAWRHKGEGPKGARVGKHVRYRRRDVDEWLERQSDPRPAA